MRCPNCGQENIPGEELCQGCGTDLFGLDIPEAMDDFRGKLLEDHLGDLPLSPIITVPPDATAKDAILKMRETKHGCVLVCDGNKLAGIITERDILLKVARPNRDPAALDAASIMTRDVTALRETDPPAYAIHLMAVEGLRHIPIVRGDVPLGLVSVKTIIKYIHDDVLGPGDAPGSV